MQEIKPIIDFLSSIVLIAGAIALFVQRKQLHITAIRNCIEDYRKIIRDRQHAKNRSKAMKVAILGLFDYGALPVI